MSTVHATIGQRLVLYGVDWDTYRRMLRAFSSRPGLRLTYDRGTLEIMTLSHAHENQAHLLGRFIVVLTEEFGLPVKGGKSTTFRRRGRQRGLEPDECYWITHEAAVRGKDRINLRTDPPPNVALEVDVTRSSLNRLAIYAKLNFPEVWRSEGQTVVCYLLGTDGRYTKSAVSRAFPGLTVADLAPFLNLRGQMDENAIIRQVRAWVRQQFGTGGSVPPPP